MIKANGSMRVRLNMATQQECENQRQLDELFTDFCADVGVVMDSRADIEDHAIHGHLHQDPGSDIHDHEGRP